MTHRRALWACAPLLVALLFPAGVDAGDIREKEPSARVRGKLHKWTSQDGIAYHYRLPKDYDAEEGANLTVILHGSNLDHRWGFANHPFKTFRPDDIVVSPDGTTANGNGGFNSLGRPADAKRFHAFLEEIKTLLKVKRTFLYGHSQGSFFAFYYAGEFPDDVDGVVGHASGVWTQTRLGKKGHHQAVVLVHGTQDPVVPYIQSAGGLASFTDAKYPNARLRSLEWWNHWPAENNGPVPHTSQQLAWVEGMTTDDLDRLEACWEVLGNVKDTDQHDYAGTYLLAKRIAALEDAPAKLKKQAAAATSSIEALVQAHIDAMDLPTDLTWEDDDRFAHFVFFMRAFDGVPACDAYVETFARVLKKHQKDAIKSLKKYWPAMRSGDKAKAFDMAVKALEDGWLYPECHDRQLLDNLAAWRKDAKSLKLSKKSVKAYDQMVAKWAGSYLKDGWNDYKKLNAKHGRL